MTQTSDSEPRNVRLHQLKTLVEHHDYAIDPTAVAEALLRRTDPRTDPVLLPPVIRPCAQSQSAAQPPRRS
jgi:hypothetical protein